MEYVFGIPILGYVHEDKWEMFFSMMSGSVILRNDPLKEYCRRYTGDQTFKEAYDRSAYILNITVTEDSFSTSRHFSLEVFSKQESRRVEKQI